MTKASQTQFPPVTYSSSFVSYLIKAANENEICDDKSGSQSEIVKMRWKHLARTAFNQSLQKQKQQQQQQQLKQQVKCENVPRDPALSHPVNGFGESFLNKDDIIDLINLKSPEPEDILPCDRVEKWVQLSGHEGSFALAGPGTIWKKRCQDSTEVQVYKVLMSEPIAEMIPKFYRNVQYNGDDFIELEDLLYHYKDAAIMDIKMGTRTFLEAEVKNGKARHDLYEKMIQIDSNAPTEEEHKLQAVTKLRYMRFREALSSSSNLGFRIEGFKVGKDLKHNKNLHMIKKRDDVLKTLESFFLGKKDVCLTVLDRLRTLKNYFENSNFFQKHEIIGSSLLIIHTEHSAGVWMIDFAKTLPLPEDIQIDHRHSWNLGNHEDGYLFGLDNLISICEEIVEF